MNHEKSNQSFSSKSQSFSSDYGFIYNPDETPTPSPIDFDSDSFTNYTFGGWFHFNEVIAQVSFDNGNNSAIPIIFKNASFDFSQFPNLNDINYEQDVIDVLLYITRGDYTKSDPWDLHEESNLETAKAYGAYYENFDFLRDYEEFSLKKGKFVFDTPVYKHGGLVKAVGKYGLGEELEPIIPETASCASGYLGYVDWDDWKNNNDDLFLHAYLVNNFDQFLYPVGLGAEVLAHYSVPLSYYYLGGEAPTPESIETPTPINTPTPTPVPTPTSTPTPENFAPIEQTPTPYNIQNLDFTKNFKLLLEVNEIYDGPLGGGITYSSDLNQTINPTCLTDFATGMKGDNSYSLTQIRLITKNNNNEKLVWSETSGDTSSELFTKVSAVEPWDKIYISRNETCAYDEINSNFVGHSLFDIQLKATTENQLFYPHQEIKFDLWEVDNLGNKKYKLGNLTFKSVNSDESGWWSPSETSWDRTLTPSTPTPTQTEVSFAPEENTPTPTLTPTQYDYTPSPITTSDFTSWFNFDEAKIHITNGQFENIVFSNVNVNENLKPNVLTRGYENDSIIFSLVKRSFDHNLIEAFIINCDTECGGIDIPDPYGFGVKLKKVNFGVFDDTIEYADVTDFTSSDFVGNLGDLGIDLLYKQTVFEIERWRNNEELDLVVLLVTYENNDIENSPQLLIADRIELISVIDDTTPTPENFAPIEKTPTPTPYSEHDLRSWFNFEKAQINLLDYNLLNVTLKNVTIFDSNKPSFIYRDFEFLSISWAIVKNDYDDSDRIFDSQTFGFYGKADHIITQDGKKLYTFTEYKDLEDGSTGDIQILEFDTNLFTHTFDNDYGAFSNWYSDEELDLVVVFSYYDVEERKSKILLYDRFNLEIVNEISPTPTPESFAPIENTPTPTPFATTDLKSWFSFDSATLNINNGKFDSIILSNVIINHANLPSFKYDESNQNFVVWSLVKRSFNHDLIESYIRSCSSECGGVDVPDPFGFALNINKTLYGLPTESESELFTIDDYVNLAFEDGNNDLGIFSLYNQTSFDLEMWKQDEEVDLVVLFISQNLESDRIDILAEDRFELTTQYYYITPTPENFAPVEETPTPTPYEIVNLSTIFTFDFLSLNVTENSVNIDFNNIIINSTDKPKFLQTNSLYQTINFTLVKRYFNPDISDSHYLISSYDVWGNSTFAKIITDEYSSDLFDFAGFESLEKELTGKISVFPIYYEDQSVHINLNESSFEDWLGEDEIDLIVSFYEYDTTTRKNNLKLYDRFNVDTSSLKITPSPSQTPESDFAPIEENTPSPTQTTTQTKTPVKTPTPLLYEFSPSDETPTPTPTPVKITTLSSWLTFDYTYLNVVDNEINFLLLSNLKVSQDNLPSFLTNTFNSQTIAFTIVKRSYSGEKLTDAYTDGIDAFAYASTLYKCENEIPNQNLESLSSFSDYFLKQEQLTEDWGSLQFTQLSQSDFETWRNGEDLDLIVTFGVSEYDQLPTFFIVERFELLLNEQFTSNDNSKINLNTIETFSLENTSENFYEKGYSLTVNADSNIFAVSSKSQNDASLIGDEQVEIFANQNDAWIQLGGSITNQLENEKLGNSISLNLDGSVIAVGSPGTNQNKGLVRIYQYNGVNDWIQLGEDLVGDSSNDEFGADVSINYLGDIVLVGSPGKSSVSAFKYNGTSWIQLGSPITKNPNEKFGSTVDTNGEGIIVTIGSETTDFNKGYIEIYEYQGSDWNNIGKIDAPSPYENIGKFLAIAKEKNVIAIGVTGSYDISSSVKIYIFDVFTNSWILTNSIQIESEIKSLKVSGNGELILVGKTKSTSTSIKESVSVFNVNGKLLTELTNSQPTENEFGTTIDTSRLGDTLIIGSPKFNNSKGKVTIYETNNLLPTPTPSPTPISINTPTPTPTPSPSPSPTETPTPTPTPVEINLPSVLNTDTFLVRTESITHNSIYMFMHSFTPLYLLKRPLVGEDYVMDKNGNKVNLNLDDAKKLLFDYETNENDIIFGDKELKWNMTNKVEGQWNTTDVTKFDSNDPRMKLLRINTGCPTGCYYPNRGSLFQINLKGMMNLDFVGIYESPFVAGIYGGEELSNVNQFEIVGSHKSSGYGTFIEYPLISNINNYIPFFEYPPNLKTLNISDNDKILKFVKIPSSVETINASSTGISTINDLQSNNSDGTFPLLKNLNLSNNKNLYNLDGLNEKASLLVDLNISGCGVLGKLPQVPETIEELDISNNLFSTLTNLPSSLKRFRGKKNRLKTIPNLPQATRIVDLEGNPLDDWTLQVSDSLLKNKSTSNYGYNLEQLNISGSEKLPVGLFIFEKLNSLVANDININGTLSNLPSSLVNVELENTGIIDLNGLSSCYNLNSIKAGANSITSYEGLNNSKETLVEIKLNYNEITNGDFSEFTNTKKLLVGDNQLESFKSPNVDVLNFVGNPFSSSDPDLSLIDGDVEIDLDDSNPPIGKPQKYNMSSSKKINAIKSLSYSNTLNVKLTANNIPLPNEDWWNNSRIVELKSGGRKIKSAETSVIPTACVSVELKNTNLSEFSNIPSNLKSLSLKENEFLQNVKFTNQTNLEQIDLNKNDFLSDVDLGSQQKLSQINLGGEVTTLAGELPELETLDVSNTKISKIDLNNAVKLKNLVASNTKIKSLDASSYESLEVLNLSGCTDFGKNQTTSLLLPSSYNLKDLDLSNTSVQPSEIGNVLNKLNTNFTDYNQVKRFRYTGTSRRPNESDNNVTNLESIGWDIIPKEPTLDKFVSVQDDVKPNLSRQDLFEKKEINLLFDDSEGSLSLGGSDVTLDGLPGTPFRFGNVIWKEDEIGKTKRVKVGGQKVALVTWFGYGSNSVQISSFEVSESDCMPSFIAQEIDGEPLGSEGLSLEVKEINFGVDLNVGQPNKYISFTNSLNITDVPSEINPFGFGPKQKYKFVLEKIEKENAIKFKAYKSNILLKQNIEIPLDIVVSENTFQIQETQGYYGGHIIIGPIRDDVEWIEWEFADGTTQIADIGYGRQFQVSSKCKYIQPPPTPTPTPTQTQTPTPLPTPTPYFYEGDNFKILFKETGLVSLQKLGKRIRCSSDGSKFILTSTPYKNGKFTTELSLFVKNEFGNYIIKNQISSVKDNDSMLFDSEISGNGTIIVIGNPGYTILNSDTNLVSIPFAGAITIYEFEDSIDRYIQKQRLTSSIPNAFSRFGISNKISDDGNKIVVESSLNGNTIYEIFHNQNDEFTFKSIVADSAFLGQALDSTAEKLHSKYALSSDGSRLLVPILGKYELGIIDTESGTAVTIIDINSLSDDIEKIVCNSDGTKFILISKTMINYHIQNGDFYDLLFQTDNPSLFGSDYILSDNGDKLIFSNLNHNNNRGEVCVYQIDIDATELDNQISLVTKIQNTNGIANDKFGNSFDISSSAELLFTASEFADAKNKQDAGRFSIFQIEYPEKTPTPTPESTPTPTRLIQYPPPVFGNFKSSTNSSLSFYISEIHEDTNGIIVAVATDKNFNNVVFQQGYRDSTTPSFDTIKTQGYIQLPSILNSNTEYYIRAKVTQIGQTGVFTVLASEWSDYISGFTL